MPERFCGSFSSDDGSFPPSPTADGASKRLSWGKLVQKLTEFSGAASTSHISDPDSDNSSGDLSDSGPYFIPEESSDSDWFHDPLEETLRKEVVALIAGRLIEAKDDTLRCSKLLIPKKLLEHIGQELIHLAATEPCGLRGALVELCVEQGDVCLSMGQIPVDPYVVPTFQLTLVLRLDSGGLWPKIQGLFSNKSQAAATVRHALRLSTGFRVIKRKFYSSEELLIEEC
ncbi:DNA damage-inducible transcript 4 protein [Clupea harengus]|uniref:DNA damage-inducible transcript 4 protein n=1 Tax=Clupea harengus TaxID=7950 RepID=A0A6P3W2R0_CLUHA|nr:DNA damage-inducible transcript 4 protein [Clupea harengus]